MSDKVKNLIVTILFIFTIILVLLMNLIKKDTLISLTERRKLQQFPQTSIDAILNGKFFEDFEKYTMDQFIQRETFRSIKANVEMNILKKQDLNHIYQYDKKLIQQIYPLNEKSVVNITNKMNEINEKYLRQSNDVYYTIVPDKNYFVNEDNLKLNYKKLKEIINSNIEWAEYIDIFDCLELSSYYSTDSHWKQESLQRVVNKITDSMDLDVKCEYVVQKITDFKGVYAGQFPIETQYDEIKILTNELIEACTVYNYETDKETKIYDMEKINSPDKYDIYLSGAAPLLTIYNPNNTNNKELVVFRDSYASSLVPLLIEAYNKITLVDTRYISPKILNQYVDFNEKDILFVYSTLLINNSTSLK